AFASGFRSGIALPWPHAALVSTITPIFTKRENLICHLFQEPQPAQGYLQSSARSGFCLLTEALAASMLKSSAKRIGVFAPYACIARNSNSSDRTTSLLLPQIEHLPFVAGDTNSQSTQSIASRKGTYAGRLVSRPNFIESLSPRLVYCTAHLVKCNFVA